MHRALTKTQTEAMKLAAAIQLQDVPRERAGYPAPDDLMAMRTRIKAAVSSGIWFTEHKPEQLHIDGVRCLRFSPQTRPRGVVLHLHGGAFRLGCPEQDGPFAAALAARCGVDVVCPAYRLAPEHPFPAGLNDARSVYAGLVASGAAAIVISGDSAGGGLAAGLAALIVQEPGPLTGLALLSPWLDLAVTNPSYLANAATDALFSAESALSAAALYLQGLPAEHPLASPLRGSVASFPPTFINVGTGEVLADDARQMHDKLRDSGTSVQLQQIEAMEHVAVTRDPALPGSAETFNALANFIDRVLG